MTHCTKVLPVLLKGETCFGLDSMESFQASLRSFFFVWTDAGYTVGLF